MPDYGSYFGSIDGRAVASTSQIPVSEEARAAIEQWWQLGYGDSDACPNLDDGGYEALTRDLARRLQDELGSEWHVTWEL